MPETDNLRVAALVDLPRSPQAGGHVKCWERLAAANVQLGLPLDLTVYFSGSAPDEILSATTRLRHLPPVFSTSKLKFLPYVPDHTDLAPYHKRLARELSAYDLIHTTDGYFAFSRTAARVSRAKGIPLVTSFHTDTPSYTRIFTRQTIEKLFAKMPAVRRKLLDDWNLPERAGRNMENKMIRHLESCRAAFATRVEDRRTAESILGEAEVHYLRLGVDTHMFGPHRRDRAGIERDYGIPFGRIVMLFVGRVDIGKNIYTLIEAMEKLIKEGVPLHLVVAGVGPAMEDVRARLKGHASLPGFVDPEELARLYASVDGLALVSEVETRSMAGIEAIASACPVLVSKKSSVADIYKGSKAIRPIESGMESWANALRRFATDIVMRDDMRRAAIAYGQNHLAGWHNVLAEDLFPVWQEAAGAALQRMAA
jgi:glycosyltransferase involved in cell wall biosynthesis